MWSAVFIHRRANVLQETVPEEATFQLWISEDAEHRENKTNYLRQLMSGQNLLLQPQQGWVALNPNLSCFPLIWRAREPRSRPMAHLGDQNQQGSLAQVYPQDLRAPTVLTDWKFPNPYFSSQWPAVKFHNNFQEHQEQGVKHYRNFHSISTQLKPHFSFKTRDFQENLNQQGNSCNTFICAFPGVIFSKGFFWICQSCHSYFIHW